MAAYGWSSNERLGRAVELLEILCVRLGAHIEPKAVGEDVPMLGTDYMDNAMAVLQEEFPPQDLDPGTGWSGATVVPALTLKDMLDGD